MLSSNTQFPDLLPRHTTTPKEEHEIEFTMEDRLVWLKLFKSP